MLPLCKFYRYLIFRIYHFNSDIPTANVIFTLTVVHYFQLFTVFIVVNELLPHSIWFSFDIRKHDLCIKVVGLLFMVLHYFLFYNKKKWELIEEEFKDETPKQKRKGLILVHVYLIGSIAMAFIVLGVLMFTDLGRH